MEKTFTGTVKEKKREERGPVLMMDIPAMGSKWPTSVSDVPEDAWNKAMVGDVVNVVLASQNIRKNKSGQEYDGSKDWHWWWGYVRPASAVEGQKAQVAATVAVASADQREVAIRRAVALGRAVDFMKEFSGGDVDAVLEVAETFDAWLATGIVQGNAPVLHSDAPKPVVGEVTDHSTFWPAVRALHPDKTLEEIQKIVQPIFGGNLAEWIAAKPENSWAAAFEKVKGEK